VAGKNMRNPVVVVGMGEMGGVFARGFLRAGYPVYPVVRGKEMAEVAGKMVTPELVIIAVAEADLDSVLGQVPEAWRDRLVLLQNELLPNDWLKHGLEPTVISVWFEKKKGMDAKVIIPSPVFGSRAGQVAQALASIDIATNVLPDSNALLFELVLKNVYILTTNIAGLEVGGTVGELWSDHRDVAKAVASDVIELQKAMTGKTLDASSLIEGMVNAFNGDLSHGCMGRSAPARLERAMGLAQEYGLQLESLKAIGRRSELA
jgi:ketopantoate reductase